MNSDLKLNYLTFSSIARNLRYMDLFHWSHTCKQFRTWVHRYVCMIEGVHKCSVRCGIMIFMTSNFPKFKNYLMTLTMYENSIKLPRPITECKYVFEFLEHAIHTSSANLVDTIYYCQDLSEHETQNIIDRDICKIKILPLCSQYCKLYHNYRVVDLLSKCPNIPWYDVIIENCDPEDEKSVGHLRYILSKINCNTRTYLRNELYKLYTNSNKYTITSELHNVLCGYIY